MGRVLDGKGIKVQEFILDDEENPINTSSVVVTLV